MSAKPITINSNADHPLEAYAVGVVTRYLTENKWPFHRIGIEIEFKAMMTEPSSNKRDFKLTIERVEDREVPRVNGQIVLTFNLLYLQQDPSYFCSHVIPHELGHIFAYAFAFAKEREIQMHGDEWKGWVARINSECTPEARQESSLFDSRSIFLAKGGVPAECGCEDDTLRYQVFAQNSDKAKRVIAGTQRCGGCGGLYRTIDNNQLPEAISGALQFIQEEARMR